jgi:hypothetical protein
MQGIIKNDNSLKGHPKSKQLGDFFYKINNIHFKEIKNEWINELIYVESIDGCIVDTRLNWASKIIYILLHVIKNNGYIMYYNEYQLIHRFMDYWMNISNYNKKGKEYKPSYIIYKNWMNEYDRYNYKLSFEFWEEFMDKWKGEDIFDDSEIGYKTRIHFPWFVFAQLDLINSPCILKFKQEEKEIDDEMRQLYEEQYGYLNINNTNDYSDGNE